MINSVLLTLLGIYFINNEVGDLFTSLLTAFIPCLCVDIFWPFSLLSLKFFRPHYEAWGILSFPIRE